MTAFASTMYGGAHLFHADTPSHLSRVALAALTTYLPSQDDAERVFGPLAADTYARVQARLEQRAADDIRIDLEDGYGLRALDEQTRDARTAAVALATILRGTDSRRPLRAGVRTRGWSAPEHLRAGLRAFFAELADTDPGVTDIVATLPKVQTAHEVERFVDEVEQCELEIGWPSGRIGLELLVETATALSAQELSRWVRAARGRLRGLHLGAYDLLGELGVPHDAASLSHPYCDAMRVQMRRAVAGQDVDTVDGVCNELPVARHRGEGLSVEQRHQNVAGVHDAWRSHAADVRRGISLGFFQGWDVHPAQLVSRHFARIGYFQAHFDEAASRLERFERSASQARVEGTTFDDEASVRSVRIFISHARASGAIDPL